MLEVNWLRVWVSLASQLFSRLVSEGHHCQAVCCKLATHCGKARLKYFLMETHSDNHFSHFCLYLSPNPLDSSNITFLGILSYIKHPTSLVVVVVTFLVCAIYLRPGISMCPQNIWKIPLGHCLLPWHITDIYNILAAQCIMITNDWHIWPPF